MKKWLAKQASRVNLHILLSVLEAHIFRPLTSTYNPIEQSIKPGNSIQHRNWLSEIGLIHNFRSFYIYE
jgi:hypothetical protein